mmetsp:Transcript_45473/g.89435  ORF Transcript_45473/g.89435 Transcript_45473/m.89435 type:complete len:95 (+) Transcript_45473:1029-1313(+)
MAMMYLHPRCNTTTTKVTTLAAAALAATRVMEGVCTLVVVLAATKAEVGRIASQENPVAGVPTPLLRGTGTATGTAQTDAWTGGITEEATAGKF